MKKCEFKKNRREKTLITAIQMYIIEITKYFKDFY